MPSHRNVWQDFHNTSSYRNLVHLFPSFKSCYFGISVRLTARLVSRLGVQVPTTDLYPLSIPEALSSFLPSRNGLLCDLSALPTYCIVPSVPQVFLCTVDALYTLLYGTDHSVLSTILNGETWLGSRYCIVHHAKCLKNQLSNLCVLVMCDLYIYGAIWPMLCHQPIKLNVDTLYEVSAPVLNQW